MKSEIQDSYAFDRSYKIFKGIDENGKPICTEPYRHTQIQTRYDEQCRVIGQNIYDFDRNGNAVLRSIEETSYAEDGSKTETTYDASGRIIGQKHYTNEGVIRDSVNNIFNEDGTHSQTQTTYDEKGRILQKNSYAFDKDNNATLTKMITHEYGSNVNTTNEYDAMGRIIYQENKNFDENGNLSSTEFVENTFNEDGSHTQTQTTCDEKGRVLQINSYAFDKDNNATLTQRITYGSNVHTTNVYDAMGRIIYQENKNFDENGKLSSTEIAENTFNEDGSHTQTQTFKRPDGSIESIGVHKFNSSNQIIESSVEHFNGQDTVQYKEVSVNTFNADGTHSQLQKIYDALGNLIKQINYTFDEENNIISEDETDV